MLVAIDSATPLDDAGNSGNFMMDNAAEPFGGYGGPMRTYGRMYGSMDFDDVAIDSATPLDDAGNSGNFMMDNAAEPFGGYGGPMRTYGRMYGSMDFDDWGYGMGGGRPSRADLRYRPY
ncbi:unnamed protein product [Ilex paraguariensis]|uniref:Uncharacterized protein n=1 Tax=Ilex paraguariensis TaxID=185542 RepID=A0ABC8TAU5_9AQUA